VYERLRASVKSGELQSNERLVEADLAQSLGVGRGAVRTALARLEQEGIVQREPNRGARVRLVSEAEAVEIIEVRAALEALAARFAAQNATSGDVSELEAILADMRGRLEANDLVGYSSRNGVLHQKLLEIARHATAAAMLDRVSVQSVRHQFRTILAPGRPAQSLVEHSAIVSAVAAGDADAAEVAMRNHVLNVAHALRAVVAAAQEDV
jgi:DNA-binding GntR family transcriptional regulator